MKSKQMTITMTTRLIPLVLLATAGLAFAQPKPDIEPELPIPAAAPIGEDDLIGIAKKIAAIDMATQITAGELAHEKMIYAGEALARLSRQIEVKPPKRETLRDGKWRGCGSDPIESPAAADAAYDCGRRALDRAAWDEALQSFSSVAASKQGSRAVVGAFYWRAYAQNRLGQRTEALATLSELKSAYPSSGWAAEANALEVEIRQSAGQRVSPDAAPDEDMKLLALQGLAASDVDTAIPMIENVLKGSVSPRVKERALFVLAQSSKPAAREVVVRVAKGGSNPDLQLKAVQYVGMFRSPEAVKVLGEVYSATTDATVRRAILRSYMVAGAREPLLTAARQETTPELRLEAVRQLANLKAGAELAELYTRESSAEVKKQILRGLAIAAQNDKLMALAQSETDPELRRTAIRNLGLNRDAATGALLAQLYAKDQSKDGREAVIDALFTRNDAAPLVTIARQEKDPALKLAIVRRLSMMTRSPEALEYMKELLK